MYLLYHFLSYHPNRTTYPHKVTEYLSWHLIILTLNDGLFHALHLTHTAPLHMKNYTIYIYMLQPVHYWNLNFLRNTVLQQTHPPVTAWIHVGSTYGKHQSLTSYDAMFNTTWTSSTPLKPQPFFQLLFPYRRLKTVQWKIRRLN